MSPADVPAEVQRRAKNQRSSKKRRWISAAGVAVGTALLCFAMWSASPTRQSQLSAAVAGLPTINVTTGDVVKYVSAIGVLEPVETAALSFGVSGRVRRLAAEEGADVLKNEILCELDYSELEFAVIVAQDDYDRALLEAPEAIIRQREAALRVAHRNLDAACVRAPFSGRVTSVSAAPGDFVAAGTPILTLADVSSYLVRAEIDEIDLAKVKTGMAAEVRFDAFPHVALSGTVCSIGVAGRSRGELATIPVNIAVDDSAGLLWPGISSQVKIRCDTVRNVTCIPVHSWAELDGVPSAFITTPTGPMAVGIEPGMSDGVNTEVRAGLRPGDVIVENALQVQDRLRQSSQSRRSVTFDIQRTDQ